MKHPLILAIDPGSTSTKIGLFRDLEMIFEISISHTTKELKRFAHISDQFEFRKEKVLYTLKEQAVNPLLINAVVGRGGLIQPVPSGVYEMNEYLAADLRKGVMGEHASNLGGLIAQDISYHIPFSRAFIADPVVVDELDPVARITGHPLFTRQSIFHALNQKAIARTHAEHIGREYDELNLIIAHLGGGITVGAHRKGRVVDVNQGLNGEGPFSPERSGTLPTGQLVDLCFSGDFSHREVKEMLAGKGGYVAYLGTNNAQEVEEAAARGERMSRIIRDALVYQVAKDIGALSTVLEGEVDAILLTGGLAYSESLTRDIIKRVKHLAEVHIYPGEQELKALAWHGWAVLTGREEVRSYPVER